MFRIKIKKNLVNPGRKVSPQAAKFIATSKINARKVTLNVEP